MSETVLKQKAYGRKTWLKKALSDSSLLLSGSKEVYYTDFFVTDDAISSDILSVFINANLPFWKFVKDFFNGADDVILVCNEAYINHPIEAMLVAQIIQQMLAWFGFIPKVMEINLGHGGFQRNKANSPGELNKVPICRMFTDLLPEMLSLKSTSRKLWGYLTLQESVICLTSAHSNSQVAVGS